MRSALPVETDKTTQKQVYYWWRQRSSAIWRPHDNAFLSAMASIQQDQTTAGSAPPSANVSARLIESHGQVRGMMLLAEGLIETLAASTIEISMDGTFGTNNAGHELLGVLAEMDGTGVPLAYCFLDTRDLPEDGCKINIIKEVLNALKDRGIDPQFVGCDKDSAEIAAFRSVWPQSKIQLCYWHVLRAVRQRLASSIATSTKQYHAFEVTSIVPGVETCWGSTKGNRHDKRLCRCACKLQVEKWDKQGKMECSKEESVIIIQLISRHFNEHTSFPTLLGTYLTVDELHRKQAKEAYDICRAKDWARVWAYLWVNWYCKEEWILWARGAGEKIPILKSTMVT
ncbi:hypothetical protein CF328_g8764, partial [Tilletia controversa]